MKKEEPTKKEKAYNLLAYLAILILATRTVFYKFAENWPWIDALYFSAITLTTVGFGDLTPTTPISKLFTVLYIFVGIGIIFAFINQIMKQRRKIVVRK